MLYDILWSIFIHLLYYLLQSILHMFLKFNFDILDMSQFGCFIPEKGITFPRRIRLTSKKPKNIQYFRYAICCREIFQKSGMSDMWSLRSDDDKVPRKFPIDLPRQNFLTLFPLNFTNKDRFFHVGIFNILWKKFWLIITPLPYCVSRLQNKI